MRRPSVEKNPVGSLLIEGIGSDDFHEQSPPRFRLTGQSDGGGNFRRRCRSLRIYANVREISAAHAHQHPSINPLQ